MEKGRKSMQEWRLGSYELVRRLGEGGMAQVYLARDVRLGREVAIKVLDRHLAERPGFRERFLREARVAAALDHPNIVPLYDFGESGVLYLVMPYVSGGSLQEKLKRAPFHMGVVATYGSQIADALAYAHQRSVVHRDVKPANMLLHADGRVMLSDFGLAKIIDQSNRAARPRNHPDAGTPEYMAPEQINGHSDERSDIYALGVVLYLLLTGRLPFTGSSSSAVMEGHLYRMPEAPRRYNPSLSAAMEAVVLRAMAKRPEDRFQRANELGAALLGALIVDDPVSQSGVSLLSRPSTPSYPYPPTPQRRPNGPHGFSGQAGRPGVAPPQQAQQAQPIISPPLGGRPGAPDGQSQRARLAQPTPGAYDASGRPDTLGYPQTSRQTTHLSDLPDLPDLTHMNLSRRHAADEGMSKLPLVEDNSGELPRLDLADRTAPMGQTHSESRPISAQPGEGEPQPPQSALAPRSTTNVTQPRQRAVAPTPADSIDHPIGRRTAQAPATPLSEASQSSRRLPIPAAPTPNEPTRAETDVYRQPRSDAFQLGGLTQEEAQHPRSMRHDQATPPQAPMSPRRAAGPSSSFPLGGSLGTPSQGGPTGRMGQMDQLDYFAQFGQQSTAPAFGASSYPSPMFEGTSSRSATANSPIAFTSAPTMPGLSGETGEQMSEEAGGATATGENDPLLAQAFWQLTTIPGVDSHGDHAGVVPPASAALLPGAPTGSPPPPYAPISARRSTQRDQIYQSRDAGQLAGEPIRRGANAPMLVFITALLILLMLAAGVLFHWLQVGGPILIH